MNLCDILTDSLCSLRQSGRGLWYPSSVPIVEHVTEGIIRKHMSESIPLLCKGSAKSWPIAQDTRGLEDIKKCMGQNEVVVDVTPNGHGDAPVTVGGKKGRTMFVKPHELKLPFSEAIEVIQAQSMVRTSDETVQLSVARGLADCLPSEWWRKTSSSGQPHARLYYSRQNDCLRQECKPISSILSRFQTLAWSKPLGEPDAVNFWMGTHHCTTTCHKDYYDNLFAVLHGRKHFLLFPPTDVAFLYETPLPTGRYVPRAGSEAAAGAAGALHWGVEVERQPHHEERHDETAAGAGGDACGSRQAKGSVEDSSLEESPSAALAGGAAKANGGTAAGVTPACRPEAEDAEGKHGDDETDEDGLASAVHTPWIAVNPDAPDFAKHPLSSLASPVAVTVEPGDILFLPACWYHRVKQEGFCVCVNAWYDMKFGAAHAALEAASGLGKVAQSLAVDDQKKIADAVLAMDDDD